MRRSLILFLVVFVPMHSMQKKPTPKEMTQKIKDCPGMSYNAAENVYDTVCGCGCYAEEMEKYLDKWPEKSSCDWMWEKWSKVTSVPECGPVASCLAWRTFWLAVGSSCPVGTACCMAETAAECYCCDAIIYRFEKVRKARNRKLDQRKL